MIHALKQRFNSFTIVQRALILVAIVGVIALAIVLIDPVRFWDSCFRACKVPLESLRASVASSN